MVVTAISESITVAYILWYYGKFLKKQFFLSINNMLKFINNYTLF